MKRRVVAFAAVLGFCLSASAALVPAPKIASVNPVHPAPAVDELLVHFAPDFFEADRQSLLSKESLEIIRPLRFAESTYLVKSRSAADAVLPDNVSNLSQNRGVLSVEPNLALAMSSAYTGAATSDIVAEKPSAQSFNTDELLDSAWHLDSTLYREEQPRTDIRAEEAWAKSERGKGVMVAVVDSTIQWDHPDLANSLACLAAPVADALPGESCGWDFVEEDSDTRLSSQEVKLLRSALKNSFRMRDRKLLRTYAGLAEQLGDLPKSQKARLIREKLQRDVEATFHGTWVAGLVAAQPAKGQGLLGVAPKADLLPIRAFDLEGNTTPARLIEATGYAAARGADVINLSLGSQVLSEALAYHLLQLMEAHPDLVIVAAAGNSNLDGVAFPAAIPGILAVGATTVEGLRASYSQYGGQLDVVAPGGDLQQAATGGILTTGGTWLPELWQGLPTPEQQWGYEVDSSGYYVQVEGTSFSSPIVAGVIALMKGEDSQRYLSRDQLIEMLKMTAHYDGLALSEVDWMHYKLQAALGFGTVIDIPYVRPSGIYPQPLPIGPGPYFFGAGLVDASKAVDAVQQWQQ